LIKASVKIIKKVIKPTGFNIGINLGEIAGAGVAGHLHFHIVPRWKGDTNFMPVISNSKVICQSLGELYNILYPEFKELKKCI
ncbi:MAG: HIT family hydrolase, partial [Candidatus Omnitrophica bacterium]|nr:HIT family hydrolase [Candidatus Omnitrophota bacterium]